MGMKSLEPWEKKQILVQNPCQELVEKINDPEETKYEIFNADTAPQNAKRGVFSCPCAICRNAGANSSGVQRGLKEVPEKLQKCVKVAEMDRTYAQYGGFPKSFQWLLEHLLPPEEKAAHFKGCELLFTDTAFFSEGKAKVIFKTDREFCLTSVKNSTKLNNQNVYKDFSNIVRERKRDQQGLFYAKYGAEFSAKSLGGLGATMKPAGAGPGIGSAMGAMLQSAFGQSKKDLMGTLAKNKSIDKQVSKRDLSAHVAKKQQSSSGATN